MSLECLKYPPNPVQKNIVEIEAWYCSLHKNEYIHSQSLTWNLKMVVSKRNLFFQGLIFRFHVKLQGCRLFIHCYRVGGGLIKSL